MKGSLLLSATVAWITAACVACFGLMRRSAHTDRLLSLVWAAARGYGPESVLAPPLHPIPGSDILGVLKSRREELCRAMLQILEDTSVRPVGLRWRA